MKHLKYIFLSCIGLLALVSCSSDDEVDTTAIYYNWQALNDTYFDGIYQEAQEKGTANGWYIVKSYAKSDGTKEENCIVLHVLEQTTEPGHKETITDGDTTTKNVTSTLICPTYKDSVTITYRGNLMPFPTTSSYAEKYNSYDGPDQELVGIQFETHYYGTCSTIQDLEKYATFLNMAVAVTDGFSTALQYMHPGDRWRVFIPYNLAYGTDGSDDIPGYSTLIFDLYLKEIFDKD